MGDEVLGALSYSTALFDEATMDRHVGYLCSILKAMAVNLEQPITAVELLAQDERNMLLRTWTSTRQEYPSHMCVHHLFEQQVEKKGDGIAVVFNNQQLTYRELNEQANRLAYHLIGLGVHPDTLVAICVDRSLAMAIGIWAILKAGGAYVPLDPTYTSDRLQDILKDADPRIVIADESGRAALGETVLSSRTVIDPNSEVMEGCKR
jgi:non-ribosomal peptide synthetase component F